MINHGFVRAGVAIPKLRVADCAYNVSKILELVSKADSENIELLCFPELSVTAYTCADLFLQQQLLIDAEASLLQLLQETSRIETVFIVGLPIYYKNDLYNTAVVCQKGEILGIVPKVNLPNNNEFYEKRWFASGVNVKNCELTFAGQKVPFGADLIFSNGDFSFGIEICEDLWTPIPPSSQLALHGAEILFNLSASNDLIGKDIYRRKLVEQQSARCVAAYVYASSGMGESTTDLVFGGNGLIAENGTILTAAERFSLESQLVVTDVDVERLRADRIRNSNFNNSKSDNGYRTIAFEKNTKQHSSLKREIYGQPFVPSAEKMRENCEEIFSIQTGGLIKRWLHTKAETLVIGISGGLDSTLALLVAIKAADKLGFDRKRVIGITMPGFGTTGRTYSNAVKLMASLQITSLEISIKNACIQHFKDINHDINVHDITYENTQARERTQILMDIANQRNGFVIGTGDLSELALGWATYNGDHMSMYAVNNSIPKTLVRYLIAWAASDLDDKTREILSDVHDTPVSPELLPADENDNILQITEDVVGPYELHDFFLYYFVRFGFTPEKILFLAKNAFQGKYAEEIIRKWLKVFLRRFFSQQFKRSCLPDGPKVGSINLSPRGDWRMPSDAVAFFLKD